MMKAGFATGISHYDSPPAARSGDLVALRDADAFANVLNAWADFDGSRVAEWGGQGGVMMRATTVRVGPMDAAETGLARELSALLVNGTHQPVIRKLATGDVLAQLAQGHRREMADGPVTP